MKSELLALWCLCKVALIFGIVTLQVFGDCKLNIKWDKGDYKIKVLCLSPWCNMIQKKIKKKLQYQLL